jgi:hypothetical protein
MGKQDDRRCGGIVLPFLFRVSGSHGFGFLKDGRNPALVSQRGSTAELETNPFLAGRSVKMVGRFEECLWNRSGVGESAIPSKGGWKVGRIGLNDGRPSGFFGHVVERLVVIGVMDAQAYLTYCSTVPTMGVTSEIVDTI